MKILKKPENIVFDTENPEKQTLPINPEKTFNPLFQNIHGGEWAYLNKYFKKNDGTQHAILNNFEQSYYHVYHDAN